MKRLFGTDGIRAVAGEAPLDPPTVRRFGAALAEVLESAGGDGETRVVLGRDTRESGPWLRDALVAGLSSRGAAVVDAGVITTPGLARVIRQEGFAGGVMISASHNPFEDNGLKAFGADGAKLSDALEVRIERRMIDEGIADPGDASAAAPLDDSLVEHYVEHLARVLGPDGRLADLRLVLDCANGAACAIAPRVFRSHGALVEAIGVAPDGRNINLDCGSLHLDLLSHAVRERSASVGLAFDGDADRCLAVDRRGRVADGDHILFVAGRRLKRRGELRGNSVVATIMSNFWLEERLGREGIELRRTAVGDKYVLEEMVEHDLVLGGEQSGHVIFREHATTGDGILTGLQLLDALADGPPLEEILDDITPYPQVLLNVKVREKPDLRAHPRIGPAVREIEAALDGHGRVVLRYSGTEPKARVMLEGQDPQRIHEMAERLAALIAMELG